MKHLLAAVAALASCHHASAPSCTAQLDDLAKFYDAVAADSAHAVARPALREAELEAGVRELPSATGAPADLSNADLLLVGTTGVELVQPSGDATRIEDFGSIEPADPARALVVEIDTRVPWQQVEKLRQRLWQYKTISVGYRTGGALAGHTPPKLPGDRIDIPTIGDALAKTTATHCPDYAKQLAALQTGGAVTDPALLRSLGGTLARCDCGVDLQLVEALPYLLARPLVTTVPLVAGAPALHGADSATWGDLVRDAKGPVPMTMPAEPPPPPPPPPRRH